MKNRCVLTMILLAAASGVLVASVRAQKAPANDTAKKSDTAQKSDAPKKSEPTPRLPDGHPDFSGVWYQGIVPDINHMPPNTSYREYDTKVTP